MNSVCQPFPHKRAKPGLKPGLTEVKRCGIGTGFKLVFELTKRVFDVFLKFFVFKSELKRVYLQKYPLFL